jgi:hypothetical protein
VNRGNRSVSTRVHCAHASITARARTHTHTHTHYQTAYDVSRRIALLAVRALVVGLRLDVQARETPLEVGLVDRRQRDAQHVAPTLGVVDGGGCEHVYEEARYDARQRETDETHGADWARSREQRQIARANTPQRTYNKCEQSGAAVQRGVICITQRAAVVGVRRVRVQTARHHAQHDRRVASATDVEKGRQMRSRLLGHLPTLEFGVRCGGVLATRRHRAAAVWCIGRRSC